MEITKEQALEIYNQVGNKALFMVGAKDRVYSLKEGHISFSIMKNPSKSNKVRISLNEKDLYDVKFFRIWGAKVSEIDSYNDVYASDLRGLLSSVTGLDVAL